MLSIIKQFLPASSRSLHAMHDDINRLQEELDRIYHRIEVADSGINMNINYKFDNMAIPLIESIAQSLDAHDEHMKMFAWEEYKRSEETIQEAKERFFKELPKATGGLRLLQLGCGKLLGNSTLSAKRTTSIIGLTSEHLSEQLDIKDSFPGTMIQTLESCAMI